MLRVFYAQPVDTMERDVLRARVEAFREAMIGLQVEVVAPYLLEPDWFTHGGISSDQAKAIVRADLAAVDGSDLLVADLSAPGWQFVGVIFEMAYAFMNEKPIIVYTGSCEIGNRTFIAGTATHICSSMPDARRCIEETAVRRGERYG